MTTIQRYTASPEMGFADGYYVELTPDPDGKIVLYDDVAHWLNPDAPLEEGTDPYVAFARRHSERADLTVEVARTIIRGLAARIERANNQEATKE